MSFLPLYLCLPSEVSCVVLAPPAGHRNPCLICRALCRCSLLFFSFRFFISVWSCRAVMLLVHYLDKSWDWLCQQTATLSPRDSACTLRACMISYFCFLPFVSFLFLFSFLPLLPFFALLCITVLSSPLFRGCACTTAMLLVLFRSN